MSTIADLRPGDIGFGPIHGPSGALVELGQLTLGEGFRVGQLDIRHVFVVTDGPGPFLSGANAPFGPLLLSGNGGAYQEMPKAVEAMPSGARAVTIADRWTSEYAYVRLPEDYPGQGRDAAAVARAMIGTPYSWLSYVALAAWRFGLKTKRLEAWIDRRKPGRIPMHSVNRPVSDWLIALPREAICSVLADQAWSLTGKQVMPAGTPHQCVTPGALARALLEKDGVTWTWPS